MESAHRTRLASKETEEAAARARLGCKEVLVCAECEELFNADKALHRDGNTFCGAKCAGVWGKARSMPTLQAFLDDRFMPDAETRHKAKPATVRYYRQGSDMLINSKLSWLRLDELTSEHGQQFAAEFGRLSPSGINRGLRTLRRALNLAYAWGQIERPVKIELAKGVSTNVTACCLMRNPPNTSPPAPQPWRDCATLILEEGFRPGEVFALRWSHILFGEDGGLIRIVDGKSKAARRVLPMTATVYAALKARHEAQGHPGRRLAVPVPSSSVGHLTQDAAAKFHATALETSKVAPFVPYSLRHTGLTRLGRAARGDVFALAKIAGHLHHCRHPKVRSPRGSGLD